jgi:hypothetical protein
MQKGMGLTTTTPEALFSKIHTKDWLFDEILPDHIVNRGKCSSYRGQATEPQTEKTIRRALCRKLEDSWVANWMVCCLIRIPPISTESLAVTPPAVLPSPYWTDQGVIAAE